MSGYILKHQFENWDSLEKREREVMVKDKGISYFVIGASEAMAFYGETIGHGIVVD